MTKADTPPIQPTPTPDVESDPRWQQVVMRDGTADGYFVYGVKTTGVYCRPSCPSRRAKPQNVQFFDTPDRAEAAGFRPCQRCHPKAQSMAQMHAALVAEACAMIEAADDMPKLDVLADRIGMSAFYFHRLFKRLTGLTPKQWGVAHRARKMRVELADKTTTVTGAIYGAGFASNSRFYEHADGILGMTAQRYRDGGAGVNIRFAVGQSSLGAILVAQSARGICAITLGDDPGALVQDLQDRFPKAQLIGDDVAFAGVVARVVGFVEAPGIGLDLPLDIQGTAFQERVWQALRHIPVGETASYAAIARCIGAPKAIRAVAQACAANQIAVAIPCHRVVRTDGALSGYRWGVERKRALLDKEANGQGRNHDAKQ